jgi:acetyltransferase
VQLAKIEGAAREQLASMLPPHAAHDNPIDVLGDAAPQLYAKALEVCLDNPSSDGLLVLLTPQAMTNAEEVARAVAERSARSQKPVLACFMGGSQVERALALLTEQGVPCFDSPEAAVEAFANLGTFRRNQELLLQVPERASDRPAPDIDGARLIVEHALSQGRSLLSQLESNAVLHAFGLPTVSAVRASNADDALVAAESLGLPVALKIDTPDITHKTEVAGVRLDVRTAAMVRTAYQELVDEVRRHRPDARIQGVLVEPMVRRPGARELCIGLLRDPTFGPAVSFGAGGTLVELIRDQAVALPPLNDLLARDMIAQTKVSALLGHFRNQPAVNLDALVRALLCVSDLACELPEIKELDINPLVADAEGVMALDARIVVERVAATQRSYTHVAICPFPKHLTRHVQLSDGRNVTLRPVRPEDARMEERFVRTLSSESKYFRFMQSVVALTPAMLVRFTQIDYDREMALVAVTEESGAEIEIGVARYVENPDGRSCEFAVVVADDWHKKGIGSLLMGALIEVARNKGLLQMRGDVLSDNAGMLALMRHLGFSIEAHPQDETLMQVTLTLV